MGVCYLVFVYIDGMLIICFKNFINIEKNIIQRISIFHVFFAFYAIFNINKNLENIEKCPITYWLNGRCFLQIVDGDSGNLDPIYPLVPYSDLYVKCGGGLGDVFLHFMLFPTFLEKEFGK